MPGIVPLINPTALLEKILNPTPPFALCGSSCLTPPAQPPWFLLDFSLHFTHIYTHMKLCSPKALWFLLPCFCCCHHSAPLMAHHKLISTQSLKRHPQWQFYEAIGRDQPVSLAPVYEAGLKWKDTTTLLFQ